MYAVEFNSPKVHGVDERLGVISGPHVAVGEVGDVPHKLVHDLRKTDGVSGWASTATVGALALTVGDVGHVVGGVKVAAIPASRRALLALEFSE